VERSAKRGDVEFFSRWSSYKGPGGLRGLTVRDGSTGFQRRRSSSSLTVTLAGIGREGGQLKARIETFSGRAPPSWGRKPLWSWGEYALGTGLGR